MDLLHIGHVELLKIVIVLLKFMVGVEILGNFGLLVELVVVVVLVN
jgi:hypothetical protein